MISQLVYISEANVRGELEMTELARQIIPKNADLGLTGLLLVGSGRFLQVLEGEPLIVSERFVRIAEDPRHSRLEVIRWEYAALRACPDWSMRIFDLETAHGMGGALNWLIREITESYQTGGRPLSVAEIAARCNDIAELGSRRLRVA